MKKEISIILKEMNDARKNNPSEFYGIIGFGVYMFILIYIGHWVIGIINGVV